MKLFALFGLVATVAAIRVTSESQIQESQEAANDLAQTELIQLTNELLKDGKESKKEAKRKLVKWMKKEAASSDGLTWQEMKNKIYSLTGGKDVPKKMMTKIKKGFDSVDKNGNGSISSKELKKFLKAAGLE